MNTEPQIQAHSREVEFQIKRWLPVLGGIILALAVGYWIGNSDWTPLIRLATVVVVCFVAFSLQERGWILIPSLWFTMGNISLLPIPFSYHDMGVFLALAAYVAHRCMVKTERVKMGHPLDYLVAANVLWAFVAWVRHPVGFRVFESEYVGARVYVNIAITTVAAWIIVKQPQSEAQVRRLPYYLLIGSSVAGVLSLIILVLPGIEPLVLSLHAEQLDVGQTYLQEVVRFRTLAPFGMVLMLILLSRSQLGILFNPLSLRFYSFLLTVVFQLISGYRISGARILAYVLMAGWIRGGTRRLLGMALVLSLILGAVVVGQGRLYSLPWSVQRSLSFLPGKWSPTVAADASGSTLGRFRWWEDVIKYDLIKNWWVGDGIGVRLAEMNIVSEIGRYDVTQAVEYYGMYHSGPLTSVRSVGMVGLGLILALMIATAMYAWQCVKKARNTPFEWVAIYILIETIWYPFCFVVLFGDYGTDIVEVIFKAALVRLLLRMIDEQAAKTPSPPANLLPVKQSV